MAAAAAAAIASSFVSVRTASASMPKASMSLGGGPGNLDTKGLTSKQSSSSAGHMQVKANAQALPTKVNGKTSAVDAPVAEDVEYSTLRTFYNKSSDWSELLNAMTTVFMAAEEQLNLLDLKPPSRQQQLPAAADLLAGSTVMDGPVIRQRFPIRSYEIGADRTASIETLMNHLQETALNHVKTIGLLGDGFGATPEMCKRDLIWVVTKMQVAVEQFPCWGDVVEVESWVSASGKNGMSRDWHVRDCATGRTLARATSVWVMMNKHTRRLSKIPEEVRAEIVPQFVDRDSVILAEEDSGRVPKLDAESAGHVREGLTPRWGDLDVNQHVNNVKYISWILESAPVSILEKHELASITLEYRRECHRDSVLKSLTNVNSSDHQSGVECHHLLQLQDGSEILRGRTQWRPKLRPEMN